MIRRLIFLVLSPALIFGAVGITEYPLGKKCAVVWTSDDMSDLYKNHVTLYTKWSNFWDAARMATSNHVVFSPAIIVGPTFMTSNGLSELNSAMNSGLLFPINHSMSHPSNITNYTQEYIESRDVMDAAFTYPKQYTYNGADYNNTFIQWGGCTNFNYNSPTQALALLRSDNYLAIRKYSTGLNGWPAWKTNGLFVSAGDVGYTLVSYDGSAVVTNTAWQGAFNTAYNAGKIFWWYGHSWTTNENVTGIYSNQWNALFAYIGNKPEVWYCNPTALMQYRYLSTVSPPDITESSSGEYIVTVTANHAERVKYGLSYPITYVVTRPSECCTSNKAVWYSEGTNGAGWVQMNKTTTNRYFTGQDCYVNSQDGLSAMVSCGLPQTVDSFQLKFGPYTKPATSGLGFFN